MRIEKSVEIRASPEKVRAVLEDVEGWPKWQPGMKKVSKITPGPLRQGSRVRIKFSVGFLTMTSTKEYVLTPGGAMVFRGLGFPPGVSQTFRLEPVNARTNVAVVDEEPGWYARPLRGTLERLNQSALQALKKRVESHKVRRRIR